MIHLTILGRGLDVERMQKRLKCAARAVGVQLELNWINEYTDNKQESVVVLYQKQPLIKGLLDTEQIESILKELTNGT